MGLLEWLGRDPCGVFDQDPERKGSAGLLKLRHQAKDTGCHYGRNDGQENKCDQGRKRNDKDGEQVHSCTSPANCRNTKRVAFSAYCSKRASSQSYSSRFARVARRTAAAVRWAGFMPIVDRRCLGTEASSKTTKGSNPIDASPG